MKNQLQERDVLEVRTALESDVPALTSLLKEGYKHAKPSFDRKLLESYPRGTIVLAGIRGGALVATAALEPASTPEEFQGKLKVPIDQVPCPSLPAAILERVTGERGAFWSMLPLLCEVCEFMGWYGMSGLHPLANKMHLKFQKLGVPIVEVKTPESIFPGETQAVSRVSDFGALRSALPIHADELHCRVCVWQNGDVETAMQAWRQGGQQDFLCYR